MLDSGGDVKHFDWKVTQTRANRAEKMPVQVATCDLKYTWPMGQPELGT
jgi:hypothetical protein